MRPPRALPAAHFDRNGASDICNSALDPNGLAILDGSESNVKSISAPSPFPICNVGVRTEAPDPDIC
jgi:hypothetical protein